MKKAILSAVAMATMLFGMQAQTVIQTYDACDANLNNEVNVGDAEVVAAQVLHNTTGPNVVTAEQLNTVLQEIYQLLGKLTMLDDLSERLSAVEEKLGIETDSPVVDPYNGHEYVDLGVVVDGQPVYWATTNIGANAPAESGLYFAWGETQGYTVADGRSFEWKTYAWCNGDPDNPQLTKYGYNEEQGVADLNYELDPEDDAAHVLWKGAWRMPTEAELMALKDQCNWTWIQAANPMNKDQIVPGYIVSNKKDSKKFIFLPAADELYYTNMPYGEVGRYWSSSLAVGVNSEDAWYLLFAEGEKQHDVCDRYVGLPIRPVCQPQ